MVSGCPEAISPPWRYNESPPRRLSGVANRIKELRELRGLTLQQVADAAGTSLQQIQRLENGYRRLTDDWMRRIAPVLGVHPAALLLEFPAQKHSFKEGIDDVLLLEWWHTLDFDEQMGWIGRFSQEARRRGPTHHPKKRQA
jgi:transcriptional regulator with XRE-family HTH domain